MTDRISTCTSSSTSSAAGSSAGASPMPTLFKALFDDTLAKHAVPPGQLTLHADRGGPMKAKATALMLAYLGVTKCRRRVNAPRIGRSKIPQVTQLSGQQSIDC